jgi:DNA-binding MarR family transcriptional regulator
MNAQSDPKFDQNQPDPAADFDLAETLPYLLNRAGVRIGAAFSEDIQRFGVSLHQWRILASLCRQAPQNITELAAHTSIEVSTLSRIVAALVADGMLARLRSGDDARAVSLTLTDEGREAAGRIIPVAALYERIALSGMSAEEVVLLKQLLARVYDNVISLGPRLRPRRRSGVARTTAAADKNQLA